MRRLPEPELMDDFEQAEAYAQADFSEAHNQILEQFMQVFPAYEPQGAVLELGCGSADIAVRFARLFAECQIDALDGAEAMLVHARARIRSERLAHRIRLYHCVLPDDPLPQRSYDTIISNSLLHHLHDPMVLWAAVKEAAMPQAHVFIADLRRPQSRACAQALVDTYASEEPRVLQRDFYNSLCAAFTPEEATEQLALAGMECLHVETITDRHLVIYGQAP